MAITIDFTIDEAILEYIDANLTGNIVYPDIEEEFDLPYFQVSLLPIPTTGVGMSSLNLYQGIVQIDVYSFKGGGQIKINELVKRVMDLFPRNTKLLKDGIYVLFDMPGVRGSSQPRGDHTFTPVTFYYKTLAKE